MSTQKEQNYISTSMEQEELNTFQSEDQKNEQQFTPKSKKLNVFFKYFIIASLVGVFITITSLNINQEMQKVNLPKTDLRILSAGYSTLYQDQYLLSGQYIVSNNRRYYALMQADRNLVVYVTNNFIPSNALWSTQTFITNHSGLYQLILQSDGNLVMYDIDHQTIWASGTNGKGIPPYVLEMQNDGNLVLYDGEGHATWNSGTYRP